MRKKDISIVSSIDEWTPNVIYCLLLDLKESIIARPDNLITSKTGKSTRWVFRLNLLGIKVRGIINKRSRSEFPWNMGNTGLLTLYEACEYAKKNNIRYISIYGFDLYSQTKCINNSLLEDCDSYKTLVTLMKENENLSKEMDHLISLYPNVKFKNFTLNKYNFKSKNLEKIYLNNINV